MRKSCKVPAISGLGSRGDYYVEKYPGMDSGRTTDRPVIEVLKTLASRRAE